MLPDLRTIGRHMPRKRFQTGTVREVEQPSGNVWQGEWYVYQWNNGGEVRRRRTKVLGPVSRLRKQQAKADLLIEIARTTGQTLPDGDMTLDGAKLRYVKTRVATWSDNHREVFESVWKTHVSPAWGKVRLDDLDRQRLQEWINHKAENFSRSMVRHARTNLIAVIELAHADELCRSNPAKRLLMPKTRKVKRDFYTVDQARVLINAAKTLRDRLVMRLFFQVGLRPQELSVLRGNDFDFAGSRLRIDEAIARGVIKETKTEASDGWVPLPATLTEELADYIKRAGISGDTWVFHGRWPHMPFGANDWRRSVLQPLAKEVGLPHATMQVARRTTGTHANQHGGIKEAQGLLRHAHADVTANVYVGTIPAEVRRAVETVDREMNLLRFERVTERETFTA